MKTTLFLLQTYVRAFAGILNLFHPIGDLMMSASIDKPKFIGEYAASKPMVLCLSPMIEKQMLRNGESWKWISGFLSSSGMRTLKLR